MAGRGKLVLTGPLTEAGLDWGEEILAQIELDAAELNYYTSNGTSEACVAAYRVKLEAEKRALVRREIESAVAMRSPGF